MNKTIIIVIEDSENVLPFEDVDVEEMKKNVERYVLAGYDVSVKKLTIVVGQ